MYAVVGLLDEKHEQLVENLWSELDRRFGVRGVSVTPYPHVSYHVATGYELARLKPILERLARETTPFTVTTTGLGIFTGPEPVLYISVVRTPFLTELHERAWHMVEPTSIGSVDHYDPQAWLPHITLGHGNSEADNLGDVVKWLSSRPLDWEITIDNFAVIGGDTSPHELLMRMECI